MAGQHRLFNPEAGDHPLPQDAEEIAAVLQATSRCYEDYPYFFARYGTRGEAFARSDGGYLATLVVYPQSHVNEQVLWLATALASRGMPRILMEAHLDFLNEELVRRVAKHARPYEKLRFTAQLLRNERHRWIPQSEFNDLVEGFELNSGPGLRGCGRLVVAAVCDECCGLTESVSSLVMWLSDPKRFPSLWCESVSETLSLARARAAQRPRSSP